MNPLTRYFHATKSWPAVILLFHIAYWMPKAKPRWGDLTWIAKSAADWCKETALTPKQYRTAVALLRQLALIETSQHWFDGKNITHLRLTEAGWDLVDPGGTSKKAVVSPAGPPKMSPQGSTGQSLQGQPITGTTTENYEQDKSCVLAHAGPSVSFQDDTGEEYETEPDLTEYSGTQSESESVKNPEHQGKPENQGSPEDGVNLEPEAKPGQNLSKPDGVLGLEALWKQIVAEKDSVWVPDLTAKQRSQLKQFAKRCPEGKAAEVLKHTLRHWSTFIQTVKAHAGLFKAPASPHVGFLLKYVALAVKDWQQEMQLPEAMPAPVQAIAQAPAPAPKPADPATLALTVPEPEKMTEEEKAAAWKFFYG